MSHFYNLKDKQKVSMAKMAIHIYISYNIFEEKQVLFEGGRYIFSQLDFAESMRWVLFDQICDPL